MKNLERWLVLILFALIVGGTGGVVYYAQNNQLRKDVETRIADLRQAKAGLDAASADLIAAQKELRSPPRVYTFDEVRALRARIDKDQSDIQAYTSRIMGDVGFLQSQWSSLTQEEKDFVRQVQQSLT